MFSLIAPFLIMFVVIAAVVFLFNALFSKYRKTIEQKSKDGSIDRELVTSPILKKFPETNLATWRPIFINVGLILSLLVTTLIINYRVYDEIEVVQLADVETYEEEMAQIPVTTVPPPPKPIVKAPEIVEVKDEEELEEMEVIIDQDDPIEDVVYSDDTGRATGPPVAAPLPPPPAEEEIFMVVEDPPQPPGGMPAFLKYIAKNLKYPSQARQLGIEGRVFVQFVVEKDGSLTDFKVLKDIGAGCGQEAQRVVASSPKWKPGKQRGRAVKVKMVLPVYFKMAN